MTVRTRILIADSDLDSLSKIYLALVHRDYKVEATDNIPELWERMSRFRPSVLVITLNEFLTLTREPSIPVILLKSGNEDFKDSETNLTINKPVDIPELVAKIEKLIA